MLRFVIAVVVLVVFVGSAGRYFTEVFDSAEITEAQAAIGGYAAAVIQVHKSWLVQGKPKRVMLRGLDDFGRPANDWIFIMNSHGWPINVIDGDEKPDCRALWYALQKNTRIAFNGLAVKMMINAYGKLEDITQMDNHLGAQAQVTWVCQNIVAQQLLFRYRLDTGKVEFD